MTKNFILKFWKKNFRRIGFQFKNSENVLKTIKLEERFQSKGKVPLTLGSDESTLDYVQLERSVSINAKETKTSHWKSLHFEFHGG